MLTFAGDPITFAGEPIVATVPELRAYIAQYPAIEARIKARLTEGQISSYLASGKAGNAALHANARALYDSDRELHNALIDVAWAVNRLP